MKRHNSRILSVMTLFNMDMNQANIKELNNDELTEIKDNVTNIIQDDEYKVDIDYELSSLIIDYVVKNYDNIVSVISSNLVNWTIDRLSYVDRAIIISAAAEMMMNIAPKQVIINEYLEITREYSMVIDEKQVKFNNRVLEAISKNIYE